MITTNQVREPGRLGTIKYNIRKNLGPVPLWAFLAGVFVINLIMSFADVAYLGYETWSLFDTTRKPIIFAYVLQLTGWVVSFLSLLVFCLRESNPLPALLVFLHWLCWMTASFLHTSYVTWTLWDDSEVRFTIIARWVAMLLFTGAFGFLFVRFWSGYFKLLKSVKRFANKAMKVTENTSLIAVKQPPQDDENNKTKPTFVAKPVPAASVSTSLVVRSGPADAPGAANNDVVQLRERLLELQRKDFEIQRLRKELFGSHQYISQLKIAAHAQGRSSATIEQIDMDQTRSGAIVEQQQQEIARLSQTIALLKQGGGARQDDSDEVRSLKLSLSKVHSEKVALTDVLREKNQEHDRRYGELCKQYDAQAASLQKLATVTTYNADQVVKHQELHDVKHNALIKSSQTLEMANQRIAQLTAQLAARDALGPIDKVAKPFAEDGTAVEQDVGDGTVADNEDDDDSGSEESIDEDGNTRAEIEAALVAQHQQTFLAMREAVENLRTQLQNEQNKTLNLENQLEAAKAEAAAAGGNGNVDADATAAATQEAVEGKKRALQQLATTTEALETANLRISQLEMEVEEKEAQLAAARAAATSSSSGSSDTPVSAPIVASERSAPAASETAPADTAAEPTATAADVKEVAAAALAQLGGNDSNVERCTFKVSCRALPNNDILSKSDPLAAVYVKLNGKYSLKDHTEHMVNNHDPDFADTVSVEFVPGIAGELRICLFDVDANENIDPEAMLGFANFTSSQLNEAGTLTLPLMTRFGTQGNDGKSTVTLTKA